MKLKSHVYTNGGTAILYRVQAKDNAHAIEKLKALYDIVPNPSYVMSFADWKAHSDLILEQTGQAPWQRELNRQERKNERRGYGLI